MRTRDIPDAEEKEGAGKVSTSRGKEGTGKVSSVPVLQEVAKTLKGGSSRAPPLATSRVCESSIKGYKTRAPPFAGLHCTLAAQALSALQSESFFGAAADLTTPCVLSNRLVVLCTGWRSCQ